jgi:hypothetical protein
MATKETSQERMIHIRLPEDVHKCMRIRVAEEDTTIQHWVAALVERELNTVQASRAEKNDD